MYTWNAALNWAEPPSLVQQLMKHSCGHVVFNSGPNRPFVFITDEYQIFAKINFPPIASFELSIRVYNFDLRRQELQKHDV